MRLAPNNKESGLLSEGIQPRKVDVSAVHDIEGARFQHQVVEEIDIVRFSLCNADTAGDVAAQIHQGVQLDRGFALTKAGPWKQGKTQIDGAGIEDLGGLVELDAKGVSGVQRSRVADEHVNKLGIDAPIAVFVGPGQGGPRNVGANADMVQFGL